VETILISIPEACQALGVSRSTTYELIGAGKLETVAIGRRRLIRVSSIRALAGEREQRSDA
jgi:excisionase family DNA binding protein